MFSWTVEIIHEGGLLAIALMMAVETVLPIVPSEVIMPLAGYDAGHHLGRLAGVIAAGTAGSVIGGAVWYLLGRWFGLERLKRWAERHERWTILTPRQIDMAQAWFRRWAAHALLIGRALPVVRGVICVPAGVARMPFARFLLWSSLGSLVFNSVLAGAGVLLKTHYRTVADYLDPATDALLGLALACYLYRVIAFRPRRSGAEAAEAGRGRRTAPR